MKGGAERVMATIWEDKEGIRWSTSGLRREKKGARRRGEKEPRGWVEGCAARYDDIKGEKHLKIPHQAECVEKPSKYQAVKKVTIVFCCRPYDNLAHNTKLCIQVKDITSTKIQDHDHNYVKP